MSDRDDEPRAEPPPEGATCGEHPERPALAVCPRCGGYVCLACWHHPIKRCHACVMRDPSEAAPPVAWESGEGAAPARFFRTVASAARPVASAPAFARDELRAAWVFFAVSFVPLALLSQIVALTHTLLFGPVLQIDVIGDADGAAVALDVGRAMALGLALSLVQLAAFGVPYVSLARAYAAQGARPAAPLRAVLYRAFLLPLGATLASLAMWNAPFAPTATAVLIVVPLALLFVALRAAARVASGVGPIASFVVVIVAFAALNVVTSFAESALTPLVPQLDPSSLPGAAADAGPDAR